MKREATKHPVVGAQRLHHHNHRMGEGLKRSEGTDQGPTVGLGAYRVAGSDQAMGVVLV